MKLTTLAGTALLTTLCGLTAAHADEMVISSWLPPSHIMNEIIWPEFINRVETATEGRVTASVEYQLASPPAQADLVEDGGADAAWIFHGYNPGRFV
ncbi:MAG: C4-dicarboxylate ABC transporter substrate-binding protein, partial [Litorimonas sp.]